MTIARQLPHVWNVLHHHLAEFQANAENLREQIRLKHLWHVAVGVFFSLQPHKHPEENTPSVGRET